MNDLLLVLVLGVVVLALAVAREKRMRAVNGGFGGSLLNEVEEHTLNCSGKYGREGKKFCAFF